MTTQLPPIERTVSVSWQPDDAYRRFVLEFGRWWPVKTHSIGGDRIERVVFEPRPGGCIFEQHRDGRRFQWGEVLECDPPRRVRFTWHPSRDRSTAQEVEVRFLPEGGGTRLVLLSSKWENWGPKAKAARRGYDVGWGYVVQVWAERRTLSMAVLDCITTGLRGVQALRGGTEASIARASGEISRA